jgi:hypothetical protein
VQGWEAAVAGFGFCELRRLLMASRSHLCSSLGSCPLPPPPLPLRYPPLQRVFGTVAVARGGLVLAAAVSLAVPLPSLAARAADGPAASLPAALLAAVLAVRAVAQVRRGLGLGSRPCAASSEACPPRARHSWLGCCFAGPCC